MFKYQVLILRVKWFIVSSLSTFLKVDNNLRFVQILHSFQNLATRSNYKL
jgi:hypothetical protein